MSRVNNLVPRGELLGEIPEQVGLCFSVERKARFIQQQNKRPTRLAYLRKLNKEREEPDEASASFREWERQLMQIVPHAGPRDDAVVERRRILRFTFRDSYLDLEMWILSPILL